MITFVLRCVSELVRNAVAPLARLLVSAGWTPVLDSVAAAVMLGCVFFFARRLMGRGPSGRRWFEPALAALAVAAVPFCVEKLTGVSLLWLAAMFPLVSFTLVFLHGKDPVVWWRFLLSGAAAGAATCEGCAGGVGALVVCVLVAWHCRQECQRPWVTFRHWLIGFVVVALCEWLVFGLPLATLFYPSAMLAVSGFVFAAVAFLPLAVVILLRNLLYVRRILSFWCLFVAAALALAWLNGAGRKHVACETFARMVMKDLGERKVIVGGGALDPVVRHVMPKDVKLVGMLSASDREYLLDLLEKEDEGRREVLFLSDYYARPEAKAAFAELGVYPPKLTPFGIGEAIKEAAASPSTNGNAEVVARITAYTNELASTVLPLSRSLDEMLVGFAEIPPTQRVERINVARDQIRHAWELGMGGLRLSSTLLALDMMMRDAKAMEYDSLTALFIDRNDPAANAVLGGLRLEAGRLEDAERYLRRSVEHGGGPSAYNNLAMILVNTDRGAEAVPFAKRAVEMDPKNWNVRETLAQTLIAAGEVEAAETALEEMLGLVTNDRQTVMARKYADRDCTRLIEAARKRGGEPMADGVRVWWKNLEEKLNSAEKKPES